MQARAPADVRARPAAAVRAMQARPPDVVHVMQARPPAAVRAHTHTHPRTETPASGSHCGDTEPQWPLPSSGDV
jgi:hypothetical protein